MATRALVGAAYLPCPLAVFHKTAAGRSRRGRPVLGHPPLGFHVAACQQLQCERQQAEQSFCSDWVVYRLCTLSGSSRAAAWTLPALQGDAAARELVL